MKSKLIPAKKEDKLKMKEAFHPNKIIAKIIIDIQLIRIKLRIDLLVQFSHL